LLLQSSKSHKQGAKKRDAKQPSKQFVKSKKQKGRSSKKETKPVVVEEDSSASIHAEDEEFVKGLSESQLQYFLSDLDRVKTPLEEARDAGLIDEEKVEEEEKVEVEVDAARPAPRNWEADAQKQNMLPIKRKDGTVALPSVSAEDVEERKKLEERREARKQQASAQEASGQSKRRRKLGDEPEEKADAAVEKVPTTDNRALKAEEQADLKVFFV
jgi:hypothetical protein